MPDTSNKHISHVILTLFHAGSINSCHPMAIISSSILLSVHNTSLVFILVVINGLVLYKRTGNVNTIKDGRFSIISYITNDTDRTNVASRKIDKHLSSLYESNATFMSVINDLRCRTYWGSH